MYNSVSYICGLASLESFRLDLRMNVYLSRIVSPLHEATDPEHEIFYLGQVRHTLPYMMQIGSIECTYFG